MAYTQDMAKRMLDFPSTLWNTLSNSFLCTHLMEKKAFFSPSLLSYAVVMMMVSGQMITPPPDQSQSSDRGARSQRVGSSVGQHRSTAPRNLPEGKRSGLWFVDGLTAVCLDLPDGRFLARAVSRSRGYGSCADMHTCCATTLESFSTLLLATCHSSNQSNAELAFVNSLLKTRLTRAKQDSTDLIFQWWLAVI